MKKTIIIIIVISIRLVSTICFVRWYNAPARGVEIFEDEIFEQDYCELVKMVEFMGSLEDAESVDIDSTDGTMLVHYTDDRIVKDVAITDEEVVSTVSVLMKKGYYNITKHSNTVYFARWRNQFGCFKGFAFSSDGTGELDIQFLIGRMELDKADWYYYISDYNEWRSLNSN